MKLYKNDDNEWSEEHRYEKDSKNKLGYLDAKRQEGNWPPVEKKINESVRMDGLALRWVLEERATGQEHVGSCVHAFVGNIGMQVGRMGLEWYSTVQYRRHMEARRRITRVLPLAGFQSGEVGKHESHLW